MAEENRKITTDEALDELMPKSKVEDIVQKRLRTAHEKRAVMETRIQELEEQLSSSQGAPVAQSQLGPQQPQLSGMPPMPQAPQMPQQPQMPPMQGAQQPQGAPNAQEATQNPQENMLGGAQEPQGLPQDAPLTVSTFNQLHQEQQQHAENERKQANMLEKIQSMRGEDPEFKKLIDKEDGLKLDREVATNLVDQYPHAAKRIMKKALTSEFENMKLQNALLRGHHTGNWQHYQDWVSNLLGNKDADQGDNYRMNDSKDLGDISKTTPGDSGSGANDAVENFAANG